MFIEKLKSIAPLFFVLFEVFIAFFGASLEYPTLLFTDTSCGFCETTIKNIDELNFDEHVNFRTIELSSSDYSKINYSHILNECRLDKNTSGVPMLYSEGKCTLGNKAILIELEILSIKT